MPSFSGRAGACINPPGEVRKTEQRGVGRALIEKIGTAHSKTQRKPYIFTFLAMSAVRLSKAH